MRNSFSPTAKMHPKHYLSNLTYTLQKTIEMNKSNMYLGQSLLLCG